MIQTLYTDEYLRITLDPAISLVRYARSAKPYPSIDVVRAQHEAMSGALATIAPKNLALLVDVRAAPPRNDDAFEKEISRVIGALVQQFRLNAALVRTAAGRLQVRRLSAGHGSPGSATFSDEAEALAYLARDERSP